MPREISQTALQATLSEETGEQFLALLVVEHSGLVEPIRLVHDKSDLSRADGTYLAMPFQLNFPTDTDENIPRVQIAIGNVTREIVQALRPLSTPPTVTILVVLRDSPDVVEVGPFEFELKGVTYDKFTVRADLGYEQDFLNEPFPRLTFNPNTAPGVFI